METRRRLQVFYSTPPRDIRKKSKCSPCSNLNPPRASNLRLMYGHHHVCQHVFLLPSHPKTPWLSTYELFCPGSTQNSTRSFQPWIWGREIYSSSMLFDQIYEYVRTSVRHVTLRPICEVCVRLSSSHLGSMILECANTTEGKRPMTLYIAQIPSDTRRYASTDVDGREKRRSQ